MTSISQQTATTKEKMTTTNNTNSFLSLTNIGTLCGVPVKSLEPERVTFYFYLFLVI